MLNGQAPFLSVEILFKLDMIYKWYISVNLMKNEK